MSKHASRKSRWSRLNAKEYRSAFGVVLYRAGAWEGTVLYEALGEGDHPVWQPLSAPAGRFKRPRNAMIAVEDKATELSRRLADRGRVAFAK